MLRFQATSALSSAVVNVSDLLDLMCVATAANAAYGIPVSVKLRKIEMWAPPSSTGAAVTVSIEDAAEGVGIAAPSRVASDTTMGMTRPAHVLWRPSMQSVLSKWIDNSGGLAQLLLLTGPTGTTIDVHLSWTLQDGETPAAVAAVVAGATVGRLYVRSLNSSGGNNIAPVSFPTI